MLKKHSSTTVRSAQHPNTGRNMQQMGGSQIPVFRFAFNKKIIQPKKVANYTDSWIINSDSPGQGT